MFTIEKTIILYIIEKCNSMLSCTHHNDLQYNIVVMKASRVWKPRLKGHQYAASLSRREGEIKEMEEPIHWIIDRNGGAQISLFEKSRHNFTHHSANFTLWKILWWGIASGWPQTPLSSLFIANPHPFSSSAKFLSVVCGLLKLFPCYPCYSSFGSGLFN